MGPFVQIAAFIPSRFFQISARILLTAGLLSGAMVALGASKGAGDGKDQESQRDRGSSNSGKGSSGSSDSQRPPSAVYPSIVPMCYSKDDGEPRLVRTWNARYQTVPDCRPPSPWDEVNVPANGWANVMCTTGGSFDCRSDEYYTELDTNVVGPQGPRGPTGPRRTDRTDRTDRSAGTSRTGRSHRRDRARRPNRRSRPHRTRRRARGRLHISRGVGCERDLSRQRCRHRTGQLVRRTGRLDRHRPDAAGRHVGAHGRARHDGSGRRHRVVVKFCPGHRHTHRRARPVAERDGE